MTGYPAIPYYGPFRLPPAGTAGLFLAVAEAFTEDTREYQQYYYNDDYDPDPLPSETEEPASFFLRHFLHSFQTRFKNFTVVIYYSKGISSVTTPSHGNSKPPDGWPFFSSNVIIQVSYHAQCPAGCSTFSPRVEEQKQEQNYEEQNRTIVT